MRRIVDNWRSLRRPQKTTLVVALLCLWLGSALILDQPRDPRFVCINAATGSRTVVGGQANPDVLTVARTHCTGDITEAAIKLIGVYGIEPFGSGQFIQLPSD